METENTNIAVENEEKLVITPEGRGFLATIAKWATFLAILGFVFTGLIVFAGLLVVVISPFSPSNSPIGLPMSIMGIFYILLASIYFFPSYYLFNFANRLKDAIAQTNQELFDESLQNLKKTFKFLGIMAIIVISAYLIMIPLFMIMSFSKFGVL